MTSHIRIVSNKAPTEELTTGIFMSRRTGRKCTQHEAFREYRRYHRRARAKRFVKEVWEGMPLIVCAVGFLGAVAYGFHLWLDALAKVAGAK